MSQPKQEPYHKIQDSAPVLPAGCPVNSGFTTFDSDYLQNPYPQLEKLLAEQPVFYSEQLGYLVLTRMDDILEVFKNPKIFSSENVQDPVFPICPAAQEVLSAEDYNPQAVMSNRQPPDHTRIRKYTREGFSGRRMKILEPYIRQTSTNLVSAMLAGGSPADFVSAVGHTLPGQIIFRFIGFPEQDDEELMHWTADRLAIVWGRPDEKEQVAIAENMLRYWRYCRQFVALRKRSPADDFTSELLAAHKEHPDDLTYREVESVIYGLSFAGHEIVSNFLSLSLLNLLPDRKQWQALCENPSLIPGALEEILRVDSPQTSWRRVATQDTCIGNVRVPKGTRIFLSLGAANHEPGIFEQPAVCDIRRKNAARHISFGHGIHFCLGARLARLEGQIALETLTQHAPDLRLVPAQQLEFSSNITFRGPKKLYVEWG